MLMGVQYMALFVGPCDGVNVPHVGCVAPPNLLSGDETD